MSHRSGSCSFLGVVLSGWDRGGLFRLLLGITGGSFPISRRFHLFLALDTPLAWAGWAGDAVSALLALRDPFGH